MCGRGTVAWLLAISFLLWPVELPQLRADDPSAPAVQLGVIAPDNDPVATLLEAKLTKNESWALLERQRVDAVLSEQSLNRRGLTRKETLKLGRLLRADGLVILERTDGEQGKATLRARLVAVEAGVTVWAGVAPATIDAKRQVQWLRKAINERRPKLRISANEAVPLSIVGIRSMLNTSAMSRLEVALPRLLARRLTREPRLFVLERDYLKRVSTERALGERPPQPLMTGRWLLEGSIKATDKPRFAKLSAQLTGPDGRTVALPVIQLPKEKPASAVQQLAEKIVERMPVDPLESARWNHKREAKRFAREAYWAELCHLPNTVISSLAEAAYALGHRSGTLHATRIRCRLRKIIPYSWQRAEPDQHYWDADKLAESGDDAPTADHAQINEDLKAVSDAIRLFIRDFETPRRDFGNLGDDYTPYIDFAGDVWFAGITALQILHDRDDFAKHAEAADELRGRLQRLTQLLMKQAPNPVSKPYHRLLSRFTRHAAYLYPKPERTLVLYKTILERRFKRPWDRKDIHSRLFSSDVPRFLSSDHVAIELTAKQAERRLVEYLKTSSRATFRLTGLAIAINNVHPYLRSAPAKDKQWSLDQKRYLTLLRKLDSTCRKLVPAGQKKEVDDDFFFMYRRSIPSTSEYTPDHVRFKAWALWCGFNVYRVVYASKHESKLTIDNFHEHTLSRLTDEQAKLFAGALRRFRKRALDADRREAWRKATKQYRDFWEAWPDLAPTLDRAALPRLTSTEHWEVPQIMGDHGAPLWRRERSVAWQGGRLWAVPRDPAIGEPQETWVIWLRPDGKQGAFKVPYKDLLEKDAAKPGSPALTITDKWVVIVSPPHLLVRNRETGQWRHFPRLAHAGAPAAVLDGSLYLRHRGRHLNDPSEGLARVDLQTGNVRMITTGRRSPAKTPLDVSDLTLYGLHASKDGWLYVWVTFRDSEMYQAFAFHPKRNKWRVVPPNEFSDLRDQESAFLHTVSAQNGIDVNWQRRPFIKPGARGHILTITDFDKGLQVNALLDHKSFSRYDQWFVRVLADDGDLWLVNTFDVWYFSRNTIDKLFQENATAGATLRGEILKRKPVSKGTETVLVIRDRYYQTDLWLQGADGSRRRLTDTWADESHVRSGPKGDQIAFLRERKGQTDAWRMSLSDREAKRLTDTGDVTSLQWKDGRVTVTRAKADDS